LSGESVNRLVVENPASIWLVVSAILQAISAIAIAVMTVFLVRFTGRYVNEMRHANELQAAANAMSSALLARNIAVDAPFLIATPTGATGTQGGHAVGRIQVQNRGGGLAHDMLVETTWGDVNFAALAPGDDAQQGGVSFAGPWDAQTNPEIELFRFKDANGVEWLQRPNQMPERARNLGR
jgi:hypothetical protein